MSIRLIEMFGSVCSDKAEVRVNAFVIGMAEPPESSAHGRALGYV